MARLEFRTTHGTWHVVGWRDAVLRAAAERAVADFEGQGRGGEFVEFAGTRAYFKRGPLHGKTRWRYALKLHVLRAKLPRVQEYYNLCWLLERLFQTPIPLAAGALVARGLPEYQFLLTEEVPRSVTLTSFLRTAAGDERTGVMDELARETARMHALGFVHHDLFPRNILVGGAQEARRVFFLDAWAGGPPPQMRSDAYDLACLLLRAPELWNEGDGERFLATYVTERAAQGRRVTRKSLERRMNDQRRSLERRERARR